MRNTKNTMGIIVLLLVVFNIGVAQASPISTTGSGNLVQNGGFEEGNTGFTSKYTYCLGQPCSWQPATYGVTEDISNWHALLEPEADHGMVFVGNGNTNPKFAGGEFYVSNSFDVQSGGTYEAEASFRSLYRNGSQPDLLFYVLFGDGRRLDLLWAGDSTTSTSWQKANLSFLSGYTGLAWLVGVDRSWMYEGNDFAIDDVYVGRQDLVPAPEPGTYVQLGTGLSILGYSVMRKKKSQPA